MKRKAEIQMANEGNMRPIFEPAFSEPENDLLRQIAKATATHGIKQIYFSIPVDPEQFVAHYPASFVYFVEKYNAYGMIRFRGLCNNANPLSDYIQDVSTIADINKMTEVEKKTSLSLGEIDPWLYCRGDVAGILSFFNLVIVALGELVVELVTTDAILPKFWIDGKNIDEHGIYYKPLGRELVESDLTNKLHLAELSVIGLTVATETLYPLLPWSWDFDDDGKVATKDENDVVYDHHFNAYYTCLGEQGDVREWCVPLQICSNQEVKIIKENQSKPVLWSEVFSLFVNIIEVENTTKKLTTKKSNEINMKKRKVTFLLPEFWIDGKNVVQHADDSLCITANYYKPLGRPLTKSDLENHCNLAELFVGGCEGDEALYPFQTYTWEYRPDEYNEDSGIVINIADDAVYDKRLKGYEHEYDCWSIPLQKCSPEELEAIKETNAKSLSWRQVFHVPIAPREESNKQEKPGKKQKMQESRKDDRRPMPSYLIVNLRPKSPFRAECDRVSIWQMNQLDPLFKYPFLRPHEQLKVEKILQKIQKTHLQKTVCFSCDDLDFIVDDDEKYGGLTEFDFVFESIATRITADDTLSDLYVPQDQHMKFETLAPVDFINGKIAFLEFVE